MSTTQELRAENDRLTSKVIGLHQELGKAEAKVRALRNTLRKALAYIPNSGDDDIDMREEIEDLLKIRE